MTAAEAAKHLRSDRDAFCAEMAAKGARDIWAQFRGRIGVVLGGGGGRGAYEAGVLLAFQDAAMPTHILTGASIGGINAASFAAEADGCVGNAEPMIRTWLRLTPLAVGIDWSRYVWKLIGLIAATAGVGNLARVWLESHGVDWNIPYPMLSWAFLAMAGTAVFALYDWLPYGGFVTRNLFRRRRSKFRADRLQAIRSFAANALVWGSLGALLISLGAVRLAEDLFHPLVGVVAVAVVSVLVAIKKFAPRQLGTTLHGFLRIPFNRGLFTNFDRTRLLRKAIPAKKLRRSAIRVLFPAADVDSGPSFYFSNVSPEELAADPGADRQFVNEEVRAPEDLVLALVAGSAIPLVFEPIRFRGRLYADGALVASQPIRPAIRMGADVLFLVMMEPLGTHRQPIRTFLDMGLRGLNLLLLQNFLADRKTLIGINTICEAAAETLGLRAEEVELNLGPRRFRYVREFTISPAKVLDASILDFGGSASGRAVQQGYRDAIEQVHRFLDYAKDSHCGGTKRVLRLQAVDGSERR